MDIKQYKLGDNLSLSKVVGQKIKDITGYVTMEFGEPVFKISNVVLENGGTLYCEGEHDMPYVTSGNGAEISDDLLQAIYDEENSEDED